jgi:hypothetical protein
MKFLFYLWIFEIIKSQNSEREPKESRYFLTKIDLDNYFRVNGPQWVVEDITVKMKS